MLRFCIYISFHAAYADDSASLNITHKAMGGTVLTPGRRPGRRIAASGRAPLQWNGNLEELCKTVIKVGAPVLEEKLP